MYNQCFGYHSAVSTTCYETIFFYGKIRKIGHLLIYIREEAWKQFMVESVYAFYLF